MDKEVVDIILKQVIDEAKAIKLPVAKNIDPKVRINPRPKKRFGCCKREDNKFVIEISSFVLESSEEAVKGIIAHEVLHTCRGAFKHDGTWKRFADAMNKTYGYNIKRTSTFSEVGLEEPEEEKIIRYVIKCKKCGKEYPRQRYTSVMKRIGSYRCSSCGGNLEVIKIR